MIEIAYSFSLLALAVALFAMGLQYLFLKVLDNPKLAAYRRASKAMAFTYLFFGVVNVCECLERITSVQESSLLFRMVTLTIASAQAFLFTYAMVSLINTKYMTGKRFRQEMFVILAFIAGGVVSYFTLNKNFTNIFAYIYTAFYLSQLIRYTLIFRKLYRRCILEMENYFSGYEEKRLRWIYFSFFSALAIGLVALIFMLFPFALFGFIFSIACLIFYVFFAIRFVNYTFAFNMLEAVITEEEEEEEEEEETYEVILQEFASNKSIAGMKELLNQWVADKQYCQVGLTLKNLADYLSTNTKYLSLYINNYEGKTFRNWIGALRVEESKRLMLDNPSSNLDTVAGAVGYCNKSAFLTQFIKQTNMSPSEWKKQL
jgi:AraC-like DNA-binding protein